MNASLHIPAVVPEPGAASSPLFWKRVAVMDPDVSLQICAPPDPADSVCVLPRLCNPAHLSANRSFISLPPPFPPARGYRAALRPGCSPSTREAQTSALKVTLTPQNSLLMVPNLCLVYSPQARLKGDRGALAPAQSRRGDVFPGEAFVDGWMTSVRSSGADGWSC